MDDYTRYPQEAEKKQWPLGNNWNNQSYRYLLNNWLNHSGYLLIKLTMEPTIQLLSLNRSNDRNQFRKFFLLKKMFMPNYLANTRSIEN